MTRQDIIKQIADAHYQLADLYTQLAAETVVRGDSAAVPVSTAKAEAAGAPPVTASATFSDGLPIEEPPVWADDIPADLDAPPEPQGFAAMCPKHRKPYKDGRYGPFCTSTTDDPAWGKERDGKLWCRITPKSAAKWLQLQAAAA